MANMTLSLIETAEDVSLELSARQRIKRDLSMSLMITPKSADERREELALNPMNCAPNEGVTFTAFLMTGPRVACERHDEAFATPSGILPASAFLGWLPGSDYAPTERQAAAEYHYYEEDDADALASAGMGTDEDYE